MFSPSLSLIQQSWLRKEITLQRHCLLLSTCLFLLVITMSFSPLLIRKYFRRADCVTSDICFVLTVWGVVLTVSTISYLWIHTVSLTWIVLMVPRIPCLPTDRFNLQNLNPWSPSLRHYLQTLMHPRELYMNHDSPKMAGEVKGTESWDSSGGTKPSSALVKLWDLQRATYPLCTYIYSELKTGNKLASTSQNSCEDKKN